MPTSATVCIDASLVVRLLIGPEDASLGLLFEGWRQAGAAFVAPTLLRYEVTNAIHRTAQAGQIGRIAALKALSTALDMPISLYADAHVHRDAFAFAARFNLPAAYDAHYLALADRLGVEFWTADRRLANTVASALPWVRFAG